MKTVPQMLRDAAAIYEQRNAIYKDNYKRFGDIFVQLMPGGVTLSTPDDFNRFSLFVQVVAKMTRYGQNFEVGGHVDSLDDMVVYGMMLQEVDAESQERLNGSVAAIPRPAAAVVQGGAEASPGATVPAPAPEPAGDHAPQPSKKPDGWYGGPERRQALCDHINKVLDEAKWPSIVSNWALLHMAGSIPATDDVVNMIKNLPDHALFGAIEDVMNDRGWFAQAGFNEKQSEWTYDRVSKEKVNG